MRGFLLAGTFLAALWVSPAHAGVIGYYSFNGNANDSSGNGANGTVNGSVTYTNNSPFGGSAITFDGSSRSNYVTVPIDSQVVTHPTETFGGWFYVPSNVTVTNQGLISNDNCCFDRSLDLDTRNGGFQYSAFTGSGVAGGGQVSLNQWVFLAVSYNNPAGTYVFQAGTNQVSGTTSFDLADMPTTYIGMNPNYDAPFRGEMADVFFLDTALSGAQLANIQQNGPSAVFALATPEPSTMILLGGALVLLGAVRTRRR
ncbi:MAG: PEP-CTERM sorting domain-containing protein [Acidobacteriota bacterium]|nr:PEP-CTERM sorting domain-containing protein [Acidobacteriota bacterium]